MTASRSCISLARTRSTLFDDDDELPFTAGHLITEFALLHLERPLTPLRPHVEERRGTLGGSR